VRQVRTRRTSSRRRPREEEPSSTAGRRPATRTRGVDDLLERIEDALRR